MTTTRPTVAVVVGGESGEHEISLRSGAEVLAGIDRARWAPFLVRIERDGTWTFPQAVSAPAACLTVGEGINRLVSRGPDVVFPAMHGPYGEDGRFQALLELLHLPYVGSGPESSAIAMNKARARDIFAAAGLSVAPAEEIRRPDELTLRAPCVVKPMRLGSSVGLMVVRTEDALEAALHEAFEHDSRVLVEQFVEGREVTAAVLEDADGTTNALPLVEIRPKNGRFFDYHAKYTPGATDEICPAPVDLDITRRVQQLALKAHEVLGCRGVSRSDFILSDAGPVILETNTIPGLTRTSLLPQAAEEAGYSFAELLNCLLDRALA